MSADDTFDLRAEMNELRAEQNRLDVTVRMLQEHWSRLNSSLIVVERRLDELTDQIAVLAATSERAATMAFDRVAVERRLGALEDRLRGAATGGTGAGDAAAAMGEANQ